MSGWLYAHLQRFVNPTPFSLNMGIEYLFMAVVGGAGHVWGAVLGAALITLLKTQLQDAAAASCSGSQRQLRGDRLRPADARRAAALRRRPVADVARAAARFVSRKPATGAGAPALPARASCRRRRDCCSTCDAATQALRRPGRGQRVSFDVKRRRDHRADRAQRGRQDAPSSTWSRAC